MAQSSVTFSVDAVHLFNFLRGSSVVWCDRHLMENEFEEKRELLFKAKEEIKALDLSFMKLRQQRRLLEEEVKSKREILETKKSELKIAKDDQKTALSIMFKLKYSLAIVEIAKRNIDAQLEHAQLEIKKLQKDKEKSEKNTKLKLRYSDLMKQMQICKEQTIVLDKVHREKAAEAEKLKKAVLAGDVRKSQDMNVKGETQHLQDKLAITKGAAASESQSKVAFGWFVSPTAPV